MDIEIIRLLLDSGLLVLIWIVQAIIYPSFLHFDTKNLIKWHRVYTSRFSIIVIPLMLGQLFISIYLFLLDINVFSVFSIIIIILIWLSTFLQFVPIHTNISKGRVNKTMLVSLVNKNWIRTVLWTVLFLYNFVQIILHY